MSLPASALRFWPLAIGLCGLPSCGGELIRLGDQSAADSIGGRAGAAGSGGFAQGGATAGGGGEMLIGPGGDGGAAGSIETCPRKQVAANEVLWIGDSWAQKTSLQARIQQLAVDANTINQGEEYESLAAAAANM